MSDRQPMAGERQKILAPDSRFETVEFAKRRKKARARNKMQKAARKKNR